MIMIIMIILILILIIIMIIQIIQIIVILIIMRGAETQRRAAAEALRPAVRGRRAVMAG